MTVWSNRMLLINLPYTYMKQWVFLIKRIIYQTRFLFGFWTIFLFIGWMYLPIEVLFLLLIVKLISFCLNNLWGLEIHNLFGRVLLLIAFQLEIYRFRQVLLIEDLLIYFILWNTLFSTIVIWIFVLFGEFLNGGGLCVESFCSVMSIFSFIPLSFVLSFRARRGSFWKINKLFALNRNVSFVS